MRRIKLLKNLNHALHDERGSASLEFSALAIPLFIPIFLFLNQFSTVSGNEELARSLAREAVRAFVLSTNDGEAKYISEQVVRVGASNMGFSREEVQNISLKISCSESPCLSPNSRVIATVIIPDKNSSRITRASSQEYVSPWQ